MRAEQSENDILYKKKKNCHKISRKKKNLEIIQNKYCNSWDNKTNALLITGKTFSEIWNEDWFYVRPNCHPIQQ